MTIEAQEETLPNTKIYDVTYLTGEADEDGNEMVDVLTLEGYLAATPDFVGLTDKEGRVVFYIPSYRVINAVATGDAIETPSGPAN